MKVWVFLIALTIFGACGRNEAQCSRFTLDSGRSELPGEFPLPEIPSSIINAEERADYLLAHFWDPLDFKDTLLSHNGMLMEQTFVNFLSVMPHATETGRAIGVNALLKKAEADTVSYRKIRDLAETYLYEPDSPMLSEDFYILFLRNYAETPMLGEGQKERAKAQLEIVMMNRPGTPAPDFDFITRHGEKSSLYDVESKGDILLFFYDPGCATCMEAKKEITGNRKLKEAIESGSLTVVAVYSGPEKLLWERQASEMPEEWIVGYEPESIEERELYDFRGMPTIYLLDKYKIVKKKDLPYSQLANEK